MSADRSNDAPDLTQEAADWHARLRSGTLTEVEEARFRAWLAGDRARRREFDELSALWDRLDAVAQSPEVQSGQVAMPVARARISRRALVGWALAASVVCAVGFVSWQRFFAFDVYATDVGEQRTVPLSDGSVITLNTSSEVRVRFASGNRSVELLRGQAIFEVAKEPTRPFIVSTGEGAILALGTSFDVYRRVGDVTVTLIDGRVAVLPDVSESGSARGLAAVAGVTAEASLSARHAIVLSAGEQVTFGARDHTPLRARVDLERVTAWRARKLNFAETPLAAAIEDANRYSPRKIELRAPELANARISGTFDVGRNDALAEGLRAYFGLQVEHPRDDLIVLTSKAP